MKKLYRILVAAAVVLSAAATAQASDIAKFGIKAGANINKMSMTKDAFSSDNRVGFTGGVTALFTIPIVNVGCDVSAMYVRRSVDLLTPSTTAGINDPVKTKMFNNYIDVPVHLRYNLSLPAISSVFMPYVFVGPDFAFNLSKKIFNDYQNRNFDCIMDFGIGFRLVRHLEIGASYGIGMTKALKYVGQNINGNGSTGRTNCWTVTAAWLF